MNFEGTFCEECVLSKHARTSIQKKAEFSAKQPLEFIHTDICGPINPESFSGKRYFISFIEDYSQKTWAYFLKGKSNAFEVFKKFKVMVEKETGRHIKAVRSNRGGEYTSTAFMEYCEEQGIRRFLTASYSPQQNCVVEERTRPFSTRFAQCSKVKGILGRSHAMRHLHTESMPTCEVRSSNTTRGLEQTKANNLPSQSVR